MVVARDAYPSHPKRGVHAHENPKSSPTYWRWPRTGVRIISNSSGADVQQQQRQQYRQTLYIGVRRPLAYQCTTHKHTHDVTSGVRGVGGGASAAAVTAAAAAPDKNDTQVIQYTGGAPESLHTTARISMALGTSDAHTHAQTHTHTHSLAQRRPLALVHAHARTVGRAHAQRQRSRAHANARARAYYATRPHTYVPPPPTPLPQRHTTYCIM